MVWQVSQVRSPGQCKKRRVNSRRPTRRRYWEFRTMSPSLPRSARTAILLTTTAPDTVNTVSIRKKWNEPMAITMLQRVQGPFLAEKRHYNIGQRARAFDCTAPPASGRRRQGPLQSPIVFVHPPAHFGVAPCARIAVSFRKKQSKEGKALPHSRTFPPFEHFHTVDEGQSLPLSSRKPKIAATVPPLQAARHL